MHPVRNGGITARQIAVAEKLRQVRIPLTAPPKVLFFDRSYPCHETTLGEVLRKMFTLAVGWGWRTDNPASAFKKRIENERERFLSQEEIGKLAKALDAASDQRAAGIIRLCMRTGRRVGEVRQARFEQFNLDLMAGVLKIQINLGALLDQVVGQLSLPACLDLPFTLNQNGRAKTIVVRTANKDAHRDPELIALIADARRWRDDLLDGRAASIEAIKTREGLAKGAVSRILPLAWLAPDIAAAILEGRQPALLTPARLRALPDLPLAWADQRALLGFPAI